MTKAEIKDKIVGLLKTLPKDRIQHYASFRDIQLARFSGAQVNDISEKDLKLQYMALRDMVNDKYRNYYRLDDKLMKPKGNPQYYSRLLSELRGEKKETWISAMRTVIFGK